MEDHKSYHKHWLAIGIISGGIVIYRVFSEPDPFATGEVDWIRLTALALMLFSYFAWGREKDLMLNK